MFCTKCGVELRSEDKFCSQCGTPGGTRPATPLTSQRLSRPAYDVKIAGVCAGFARYLNADVTLIRIIWCALSLWPVPLFGVIAYIAAWIIMPKDPLALPASTTAIEPVNGGAH